MPSVFDHLGHFIWALSSNQRWAENSNQILSKEALPNQEGEIYEVCCCIPDICHFFYTGKIFGE